MRTKIERQPRQIRMKTQYWDKLKQKVEEGKDLYQNKRYGYGDAVEDLLDDNEDLKQLNQLKGRTIKNIRGRK